MATTTPSRTGGSTDQLPGADTTTAPLPEPASDATPDTGEWLQQRIPGAMAATVGLSWYALFAASAAVEPETSNAVPVIGLVLGVALLGAMLATGIGLAACRRWGLVAALGASVLLVASAVACPTTGHHTIGTWWFFQMACSFAAVGVSVVALRRTLTT
ncbi:MAG: hypothetical protein MUP97_08870 [Acidimicrobiia bacterium]|jgi:hypothetical protein|nr:hypothetical protein [Acidimicrobiia bacterium]